MLWLLSRVGVGIRILSCCLGRWAGEFVGVRSLTVPSSTFDRFCVGVVPAVQYFLCWVEVVRIGDDLEYFVLRLLELCCTGQVFLRLLCAARVLCSFVH